MILCCFFIFYIDLCVGMMRRFIVTQADALSLASGEARTVNVALLTDDNKHEVRVSSRVLVDVCIH